MTIARVCGQFTRQEMIHEVRNWFCCGDRDRLRVVDFRLCHTIVWPFNNHGIAHN
jgi:hypothetical protein